jgi:hypothetical protein
MSPTRNYSSPPPMMMDPTLCHYCDKNKLEPTDKYFLPSGIEVCKDCAARHSQGVKSQPSKEKQNQPAPGLKRSPNERTAEKLLEHMGRNKATRKRKQGTEPPSKKPDSTSPKGDQT